MAVDRSTVNGHGQLICPQPTILRIQKEKGFFRQTTFARISFLLV